MTDPNSNTEKLAGVILFSMKQSFYIALSTFLLVTSPFWLYIVLAGPWYLMDFASDVVLSMIGLPQLEWDWDKFKYVIETTH